MSGKEAANNTAQMARIFDMLQPRGRLITQRACALAQLKAHTAYFVLVCCIDVQDLSINSCRYYALLTLSF